MSKPRGARIGRREFVGMSVAAAGVTILKPRIAFGSQANSAVRLGLLGCGGRGRNVTVHHGVEAHARTASVAASRKPPATAAITGPHSP